MHTQVEVCSFKDLENTAKLIAETILKINPSMNFGSEITKNKTYPVNF